MKLFRSSPRQSPDRAGLKDPEETYRLVHLPGRRRRQDGTCKALARYLVDTEEAIDTHRHERVHGKFSVSRLVGALRDMWDTRKADN